MAHRAFPEMVAARFTGPEKALIEAAAECDEVTVHELVRRVLLPAVRRKLADVVGESRAA